MILIVVVFSQQAAAVETAAASRPWTPQVWRDYLQSGPTGAALPDFSRAGYRMGGISPPHLQNPLFNVTDASFGAVPDDGLDDAEAIQRAIDAAGQAGGGVVFLPAGRYDLKSGADRTPLLIRKSGIVLRGERAGGRVSTLYVHSPGPDRPVRRLGTVPSEQEARSYGAAVAVLGSEERTLLAEYTADVHRGERLVRLADTSRLHDGQMVLIECTDPAIDEEHPAPEKADLVHQLTAPFVLTADQVDTFGKAGRNVTWLVRVEKVVDEHTIRLVKPARFDQLLRFSPRIYSFAGLREVGVETLEIACDWPGGYRHHKPFTDAQGAVIRTAKEQDYLWNGVWLSNTVDSWVRDVTFTDLTQGLILCYCADTSLTNLRFLGQEGHAGITIGRSNGVLVADADFYARLVHPVTLTILSSGNVVTRSTVHYRGRDEHSATDAVLDFHGLFPFENLFDNLSGFYICPGGDMSVLPHGGVRNVFWNITAPAEMSCYTGSTGRGGNEFMRTYAYGGTSSGTAATMFEHLPQAFYVGIHREQDLPVTVGGSDSDRQNGWFTVEGLNRQELSIPSLYLKQQNIMRSINDNSAN